ncbi:MAG: hypothetical protein AAFU64_01055 [Bacteroidota bacterium]
MISLSQAQHQIRGRVLDEDEQSLANVLIQLDSCPEMKSDEFGVFGQVLSQPLKFPQLKAKKEGYMLIEWTYEDGFFLLSMAPSIRVEGVVRNQDNLPVSDINILVLKAKGVKKVTTNAQGKFFLDVPQSHPIQEKDFLVAFDSEENRSQINYSVEIKDEGLVNFKIRFVPREVAKLKVVNEADESVAQVRFYIDGQLYTSDQQGEMLPRHPISDLSIFQCPHLLIEDLKFDPDSKDMLIRVRSPRAEDRGYQSKQYSYLDARFYREGN